METRKPHFPLSNEEKTRLYLEELPNTDLGAVPSLPHLQYHLPLSNFTNQAAISPSTHGPPPPQWINANQRFGRPSNYNCAYSLWNGCQQHQTHLPMPQSAWTSSQNHLPIMNDWAQPIPSDETRSELPQWTCTSHQTPSKHSSVMNNRTQVPQLRAGLSSTTDNSKLLIALKKSVNKKMEVIIKKERGLGAVSCSNCKATSHRLERCLGPLVDGMLPGCPHHNSIKHSFDDCTEEHTRSNKGLLWYLVESRAGRPPVVSSRDWRQIPGAAESKARPWSVSFALENSSYYKYYDYGKDPIPNSIPLADPGWTNGSLWQFATPYQSGYFTGHVAEHVTRSERPLDYGDYIPEKKGQPSEHLHFLPPHEASPFNDSSKIQRHPSETLHFRLPQENRSLVHVSSKIQRAFNGHKRNREEKDRDDNNETKKSAFSSKRFQSSGWHQVETAGPGPAPVPQNVQKIFTSFQSEVDRLRKIALDTKQAATEAKQTAMEVEIAILKRRLAARNLESDGLFSKNALFGTASPLQYSKDSGLIQRKLTNEPALQGLGLLPSLSPTAPPATPSFRNADVREIIGKRLSD